MTNTEPDEGNLIQAGDVITCWLDEHDTIVEVSQTWDRFALSNNADKKTLARGVIGRTIFSFIIGDPTRMYLQALLQQVRILGRSLARTYRCDSPELKRYMEMRLTPEESGLVRIDHTLLRVEPFSQPVSFYPADFVSSTTIGRCSVCANLKTDLRWIPPEKVLEQAKILYSVALPVSYLVCPACLDRLMDEAAAACITEIPE